MTQRDGHSNIKIVNIMPPLVVNNDTEGKPADGSGVDTKGFDTCEIVVHVGDSGDTLAGGLKHELILQHSDTTDVDASYSAVTSLNDVIIGSDPRVTTIGGTGIFATIDAPTLDQKTFRIGYRGSKRFVRAIVDTTGTHTNGTPIGMIGILGKASQSPCLDA